MFLMIVFSLGFMLFIMIESLCRIFRADEMTDVSDDEGTTRVVGFFSFLLTTLVIITIILLITKAY